MIVTIKNRKILLLLVLTCFFLSLICPNIVNSKILENSSSLNRFFYSYQNHNNDFSNNVEPVNYLCASSHYDYGLKVGKRFRLQFKLLDIFSCKIKNNQFDKTDIKNHINVIQEHYPFYFEELRGLSDSLGLKIERILSISNFLSKFIESSCTTTLSTGIATKNNETFVTQNLDNGVSGNLINKIADIIILILFRLSSYKLFVVKINTLRYRYAFFGIPIIREYPVINEMGLGFGMNGIKFTDNESRTKDTGPGLVSFQIARLASMTCKNVTEVASLFKSIERCSDEDGCDSFAWCDKDGKILMIEYTHNYIINVYGNSTNITNSSKNILWHTNHHLWLDSNLTGSVFPEEYPSSSLRASRAREMLEESYGNITLDTCKKITRDHKDGFNQNKKDSGDICRHLDKNDGHVTSFSFIVQPKKMTVYWTHRSPCRSLYWKYNLSKIFE